MFFIYLPYAFIDDDGISSARIIPYYYRHNYLGQRNKTVIAVPSIFLYKCSYIKELLPFFCSCGFSVWFYKRIALFHVLFFMSDLDVAVCSLFSSE